MTAILFNIFFDRGVATLNKALQLNTVKFKKKESKPCQHIAVQTERYVTPHWSRLVTEIGLETQETQWDSLTREE